MVAATGLVVSVAAMAVIGGWFDGGDSGEVRSETQATVAAPIGSSPAAVSSDPGDLDPVTTSESTSRAPSDGDAAESPTVSAGRPPTTVPPDTTIAVGEGAPTTVPGGVAPAGDNEDPEPDMWAYGPDRAALGEVPVDV